MRRSALGVAVAFTLVGALAGCGSSAKTSSPSTSNRSVGGSINVFAASSLSKSFDALAKEFEAAHPGSHVNVNPASSSILADQILNGAPADVFASADQKNMKKIEDAGAATGSPVVFAKNQMEIAVERGNPKHIATVADLAKPGLIVVLCATEAPCGKYADQLLEQDKATLSPKSRELDAKGTLTKVTRGDADAAIVYVTDVKGTTDVDGVAIATGQNVIATLPIVALKDSRNAALAKAWVDFITSSEVEKKLQEQYGFLAP
jgi:molybdate transport system substrate-binding protein